jgi:hypothetical protein
MWQISRKQILENEYPDLGEGDVVAIEWGWRSGRPLLPRRTVGGGWVWLRTAYCRRVWVYTGFIDEPETQWGTIFDVLSTGDV